MGYLRRRSLMQHRLAQHPRVLGACALITASTLCAAWSARWRRPRHELPPVEAFAPRFSLPCLVLTLNASHVDSSARGCTPFVAPPFTEQDLDLVSPDARRKILDPALLETASELSNNASVNIYMNHARIWRKIAEQWDVALVLEEDIVVPEDINEIIAEILAAFRRDNVTNFVMKLTDSTRFSSMQWTTVYKLRHRLELRACTCQPSIRSSSSAAYIMDRAAAQTLLNHAFPASMHVDVFKHHMGCTFNKINFFQTNPHVMNVNNRPSKHLPHDFQRRYLLLKEVIVNAFNSTC
jgi:hypothetical protein